MFALTVRDFGVQHTTRADVDHLITSLLPHYQLTMDWEGKIYCGLHLKWDYDARTMELSMPNYVQKALLCFCRPTPKRPQHTPHKWTEPTYRAKQHFAEPDDSSPALNADGLKRVQEVVGTLHFYCCAVDLTMHVALGTISAQQSEPTELIMDAVVHLLNYCATHPDTTILYRASKMVLIKAHFLQPVQSLVIHFT